MPEEGNRRYSAWPEVPHRWSTNRDKLCIFHGCLGNTHLGTLKCISHCVTAYLKHRLNTRVGLNSMFHRPGRKHYRFHPSDKIPVHSWPRRALLLARVTCLCRTNNCCQQVPSTRNRTHDKLHTETDPGSTPSHMRSHTAHSSLAGMSGTRSTQIRWCRLSMFHCRLSKCPHPGRSPVHRSPHSAHSAAASLHHGRRCSDQRSESRSNSLDGTQLAGSAGSSRPPAQQAGCPAGRVGRSAASRSPRRPGTRTRCMALPSISLR